MSTANIEIGSLVFVDPSAAQEVECENIDWFAGGTAYVVEFDDQVKGDVFIGLTPTATDGTYLSAADYLRLATPEDPSPHPADEMGTRISRGGER